MEARIKRKGLPKISHPSAHAGLGHFVHEALDPLSRFWVRQVHHGSLEAGVRNHVWGSGRVCYQQPFLFRIIKQVALPVSLLICLKRTHKNVNENGA